MPLLDVSRSCADITGLWLLSIILLIVNYRCADRRRHCVKELADVIFSY